jgi:diguanylate cyclase (GGDEF)-like protein
LVGASAERARNVAQRLCARTRELRTQSELGLVQFTVSCGVTGYKRGEGLSALLERADQALYRAKRDGRDQVVLV